MFRRSIPLAILAASLARPVLALSPNGYAGNAGWIDFGPGTALPVHSGATFLSGYAYAANFGWIDFGDGTPANGAAYSNSSAGDYGVNHDGAGKLSGYAYGANVGWINFSWAASSDPNRPRVDVVTGAAAGFVYSANVGWIDLGGLTMPGVTAAVALPPRDSTPVAGSEVTLRVVVGGTESLTFQWLFNGADLAGATGRTYVLASAQRSNAGDYAVRITRENGATFDVAPGRLEILAPPPNDARLLNLSTRAQTLTGDNILIPGFVVSGPTSSPQAGTKKLLIRAVGPTLSHQPFNIATALDNPRMTLKRLDFTQNPAAYVDVDSNDDWMTNPNAAEIDQAIQDLFAFDFQDDREAALLVDLAPGQYTVFADGVANATGVAIVELYDADAPNPAATLINISNRGFVGTGDNVMIPGFVVSSEGPKTLLIRVVGPTLGGAPFNVPGTMADPKLEIFPAGSGTPILTQDNWGDSPDAVTTAQVASSLGAFALADGSADAAFVVTLAPGSYTVVGSSADGTSTGVVLVEVYVVP